MSAFVQFALKERCVREPCSRRLFLKGTAGALTLRLGDDFNRYITNPRML